MLYSGSVGENPTGLLVADFDSGEVQAVIEGRLGPPTWAPLRNEAAVNGAIGGERGTHLVNLDDGTSTLLGGPTETADTPLWSTDGEEVSVLVNGRLAPALRTLTRDGQRVRETPLLTAPPANVWGVFDVRQASDGSIFFMETIYDSELYELRR